MKNMKSKFINRLLQWTAFALLVFPVLLRVCVLIIPDMYFANDPRYLPIPPEGLGPAGSIFLDWLSITGLALALIYEQRVGRGINWLVMLLFIIPIGVIAYHSSTSLDNMRTGSNWIAAVAVGIGAAHLSRDATIRFTIIASIMALIVPLSIKAIYQVFVEHPIMVDEYSKAPEMVLLSHGWESDSIQANLYERRLSQPEATGWLALSNVFGSVLAGFTAFWITTALVSARSKLSSGWIGLLTIIALASMFAVALTFSKGAIATAILGIFLAGLILLPRNKRRKLIPYTASITILLIILAILGTIFRGAVLGENIDLDGYSLLFRWQYWVGAYHIFVNNILAGCGPEGFKAAYMIFKPPVSPEEVTFPHSVFITWISTLGISGISWIILTIIFVRYLAPSTAVISNRMTIADITSIEPEKSNTTVNIIFIWAAAILLGITLFIFTIYLSGNSMLPDFKYLFWPLAWIGYLVVVGILPWIGRNTSWAMLRWALWAAITVILVHSQIELTMSQPGSTPLVWLLIGAAAILPSNRQKYKVENNAESNNSLPERKVYSNNRIVNWVICLLVVGLSIIHFFYLWKPVYSQQTHICKAYLQLSQVGEINQILSSDAANRSALDQINVLQNAASTLKVYNEDPKISPTLNQARSALSISDKLRFSRLINEAMYSINDATIRLETRNSEQAVIELTQAINYIPHDIIPYHELAKIHLIKAKMYYKPDDITEYELSIKQALSIARKSMEENPAKVGTYTFAASIYYEHYNTTANASSLNEAIQLQLLAQKLDPHGLMTNKNLAEMYDKAGRYTEALDTYNKTIKINNQLYLDPLKQLNEKTVNQIEGRIKELSEMKN